VSKQEFLLWVDNQAEVDIVDQTEVDRQAEAGKKAEDEVCMMVEQVLDTLQLEAGSEIVV
jgi:hypothetical protein